MTDSTQLTTVYQYFDRSGQLLYVGITARGIRRAAEHAESKEWWPQASQCCLEHFATRQLALEREEQLIKRYSPPFNTVHNTNKQAARASLRDVEPKVRTSVAPTSVPSTKREADAYYSLPPSLRKSFPCVTCGERPGHRGPRCVICKPPKPKKLAVPTDAPRVTPA